MQYFYNSPSFYAEDEHGTCSTIFGGYESILLHLASNLLRRKICIFSISPNDVDEIFEPQILSSNRILYLFGYRKAYDFNFYVSVFPNDYEVKQLSDYQVSRKYFYLIITYLCNSYQSLCFSTIPKKSSILPPFFVTALLSGRKYVKKVEELYFSCVLVEKSKLYDLQKHQSCTCIHFSRALVYK